MEHAQVVADFMGHNPSRSGGVQVPFGHGERLFPPVVADGGAGGYAVGTQGKSRQCQIDYDAAAAGKGLYKIFQTVEVVIGGNEAVVGQVEGGLVHLQLDPRVQAWVSKQLLDMVHHLTCFELAF